METKKFCKLRQDLINKELGAPVGDSFYNSTQPIEYRWLDEIDFQVFLNGKWEDAESVDFDFELETLSIHDLRGTFELTNSKGEIVKDNLEDYESCEAWAIMNGYNDSFNEPLDPIEQAKQTLAKAGYFGITWTLSDIIERAKSDGYLLDEKQARNVADRIEKRHDCEIGINWENISFHISDYCKKNDIPELEFVDFEDKSYPTRIVEIAEKESVRVGILSMFLELEGGKNGFKNDEANQIDDTIYFYVEDNLISIPKKQLALIIIEGTI